MLVGTVWKWARFYRAGPSKCGAAYITRAMRCFWILRTSSCAWGLKPISFRNNCRTDHIQVIDSMCTIVCWRPPWILRPWLKPIGKSSPACWPLSEKQSQFYFNDRWNCWSLNTTRRHSQNRKFASILKQKSSFFVCKQTAFVNQMFRDFVKMTDSNH